MGITLFISEKPSLGRTVAGALGVVRDEKTHILCKDDCVVAFAQGHLYEFLEPQEYDERFRLWKREDLPLDIGELRLKPSESTKYRLDVISGFLKKADKVVHVGDPDREGQRIVDDILEQAGWKGPVERLWNTDQSPRGMAKTMEEFRKGFPDNNQPTYRNRSLAAKARAELDWRLGMNISRAIGCRLHSAGIRKVVSYGRFQTTVLAIIVAREKERRSFVPKKFYTPKAVVSGVEAEFVHDQEAFPDGYDSEGYLVSQPVAARICDLAKGARGIVAEFERKKGKKSPPLPCDLSRLIQDAARRHGISAKETNDMAQSLYDKGITTYPRVDCRHLPEAHHADAQRILSALAGLPGADGADPALKSRCFDTKKTDEAAHHAIIPTGEPWQKLTGKELQVFKIVAEAYILQFWPDMEFESQKLAVSFDGPPKTLWRASGRKVISPGWTAVGEEEGEDGESSELPVFAKGDAVSCDSTRIQEGETKKPAAFTEASIMSAMENVDRFEPNPAYKKMLRDAKGIGTGATRGGILDLLVRREYIAIAKGVITPTRYGEDLVSWVPESLRSPALTAIMEGQLEDIVQGRLDASEMVRSALSEMPEYLKAIDEVEIRPDPTSGVMCPACGKAYAVRYVSKKTNKPFWKCQGEDCGKFFADKGGKLVAPQACPKCGEAAADRFESSRNPGRFFWKCGSCGAFFGDEKGRIGKPFGEKVTGECPLCQGEAARYEYKAQPGKFFWKCSACGQFLPDENGKPGKPEERPRDKCPVCGGVAVQLKSKKGNLFWKCESDDSHGPFADKDGKPGEAFAARSPGLGEEKCPHCKGKAVRRESRNKPGVFFWACDKCGLMSDDNGKPGKVFGGKK